MFPCVDDVNYGGQGKVPEAAVDRMVADLEKQYVNSLHSNLPSFLSNKIQVIMIQNVISKCTYHTLPTLHTLFLS